MEELSESTIQLGVAALALPGQSISGDRHVYQPFPGGALVGVIDGIGHGNEAAMAAESACAILKAHPAEPVIALVKRCHDNLRSTRGVVMSLAAFDVAHDLLSWLGIGNVQGILQRADATLRVEEPLLMRAGVVGNQLPPLRASVIPVVPGDILIFATDGVESGPPYRAASPMPPQKIAQAILDAHRKGTDDALVLVARYLGRKHLT